MATKKTAAKKNAKTPAKRHAVVVTTTTRDVWYGCTNDRFADPIELYDARHCYQWDTDAGIGQLASRGPGSKAKIGPEVAVLLVRNLSGVLSVSAAAEEAFSRAVWSR
jgi:hypothetical protein